MSAAVIDFHTRRRCNVAAPVPAQTPNRLHAEIDRSAALLRELATTHPGYVETAADWIDRFVYLARTGHHRPSGRLENE
jgi:hypothetical protein